MYYSKKNLSLFILLTLFVTQVAAEEVTSDKKQRDINPLKAHEMSLNVGNKKSITSQASNYSFPMKLSVNARTGQVSINYHGVTLPAMSKETAITLGLNFNGNLGAKPIFKLPSGWRLPIDYVDVNQEGMVTLNLASGQRYVYDPKTDSGLRYYKLKSLKFSAVKADNTLIGYQLKHLNGTISQFSANGLLKSITDKHGNQLVIEYDNPKGDVYHAAITSLTSRAEAKYAKNHPDKVFSNTVNIDYLCGGVKCKPNWQPDQLKVTLPDDNTLDFMLANDRVTMIDQMKYKTTFTLKSIDNQLTEITAAYPNGHYQEVFLNNRLASPYGGEIHAVSQQHDYPLGKKGVPLITSYNYAISGYGITDNNANYLGNGLRFTSMPEFGVDGLMNSNDTSYHYGVEVTSPGGHKQVQVFNYLHLQKQGFTTDNKGNLIAETQNTYGCSDVLDNATCHFGKVFMDYQSTPANYQTPSLVQSITYDHDGKKAKTSRKRVHQVKTQFNDYGLPTAVYTYEKKDHNAKLLASTKNDSFKLIKQTHFSYDTDGYGIVLSKDVYDCIANSHTKQRNTLTDSGKNIKHKKLGIQYTTENVCHVDYHKQMLAAEKPFEFERQIEYEYDALGRQRQKTLSWADGKAHPGPASVTTKLAYTIDPQDANLLLITKTNPLGGQTQEVINTKTSHHIADRLQCITDEPIEKCAYQTFYDYDALGRLIKQVSPNGVEQNWRYELYADNAQANKVSEISPSGYEVSHYHDGIGRALKHTHNIKSGQLTSTEQTVASYEYYANDAYGAGAIAGKLKHKVDQRGNKSTYLYNERGMIYQMIDSIGRVIEKQYDHVAQRVDSYLVLNDSDKRLSQSQWHNDQQQVLKTTHYNLDNQANAAPQSVEYVYDGKGRLIQSKILK